MNLDDLLKRSAEVKRLPHGFVKGVELRVQMRNIRQKRKILLRDTVLLGGSLLVFFYALSVLLINTVAFQTVDFFYVMFKQPGLLALEEGRNALLESIPLTSLLLTGVATGLCCWLLRIFIRDIRPFYDILFNRHAFS